MVSVKMSPFNRILLTITLFAINVAAALSSDTELACREISTALPKRVSTFLAPSYTSEVNSYWAVNLREAKPACLVLPQSAEEVATIINVLNKYPSVQFAVKSGGHTPNERHSSIRGGVLISMRDISGTTYDAETQLAHVKPGGEWNDVIGELDKFGVAIVGGRLGIVGVGGYLLQGGISFLSSQHGLAADSIVGWQIVTADGRIRYVNATQDPELAVALRGSGSQFGIVTQFTVQAYPINKVWGGFRLYDAGKAEELYGALHNFVPQNANSEEEAIIFTDIIAAGGLKTFVVFYFHGNPQPPTTGPLARFLAIPSILDTTKSQSYADLLKSNGQGAALLQSRISFRTFTLPYLENAPQVYSEISAKFASLVGDYLKNPLRLTSQCSVDFQPFPAIIGKHSEALGGNAMGISGGDIDRVLLEIQCSWSLPTDDSIFPAAAQKLTDWLETKLPEWTKDRKDYLPYLMNDAAGNQNVTGTYRDYAKFKALQKEIDPQGFFSTRGGGFVY